MCPSHVLHLLSEPIKYDLSFVIPGLITCFIIIICKMKYKLHVIAPESAVGDPIVTREIFTQNKGKESENSYQKLKRSQ